MTQVKYLEKQIIDQSHSRTFNPSISDSVILTFEVKIVISKDWYEKTHNEDSIDIGDSDARVSVWFRDLYSKVYGLVFKNSITKRV